METYDELALNIRSAFRLLIHYNERIVSLINHIGEKLKLDTVYDNSLWNDPVLKDKNNLTNGKEGAIHWLPMYFHEFRLENKDLQLSVFVQSDTGPWKNPESDWNYDIDNFSDIHSSKTRFLFAITNSKKMETGIIIDDNYDGFLRDDYIIKHNKKEIVCKAFELKDFKDEKTTNDTLKRYVEYTKSKGIINIEYVE